MVRGITFSEQTKQFAPGNRPKPKRKGSSSNHPFSDAFAVSFREGNSISAWQNHAQAQG